MGATSDPARRPARTATDEVAGATPGYRALLDALPQAALVTDARGAVVDSNRAACALLERPDERLHGSDITELVPHLKDVDVRELLERPDLLRDCQVTESVGDEQDPRMIRWTLSPLVDEHGDVSGLLAVGADITEQRRLEAELAHSQKMEAIGRLASGIAHDFNNLLMGISGCADVALSNLPTNSPGRRYVEELKYATVRGASLTSQLLAFAHKRNVAPSFVNVNHAIAATESMMQRLLGENIDLVVSLGADTGWVYCSQGRLEQLLMNLILNARDAMRDGGRLDIVTNDATVETSRPVGDLEPGPYVELTVTDTGCGMSEETVKHAFEPFFTTKDVGAGTGLGLSTVYAIVRQSGGHVRIASSPGQGTAIQLFLPVGQPSEEDLPLPAPGQAASDRRNVLVVEDENLVRLTVRHYLERHDYQVFEARTAQEAVALCERDEHQIDLVLSDVVLPGAQGPQLAATLRRLLPDVAVVYMSAYTPEMLVSEGRIEPGTPALTKPFSETALISKVRSALGDSAGVQRS